MFDLIIKNANGTHYWTEHFNTKDALDKWLSEEKTRPYWKKDHICEVIDKTPVPKFEDIQAEEDKKIELKLLKEDLKAIEKLTQKEAMAKIVQLLKLQGII